MNRAHFDFAYHLISIIVAFGYVAEREMASTTKYLLRAGVGVAQGACQQRHVRLRDRARTRSMCLGADEESARLGVRAAARGARRAARLPGLRCGKLRRQTIHGI